MRHPHSRVGPRGAVSLALAAVVDIGTGGGFPGVPLALWRPDLSVTWVEPRRKRAEFLVHLQTALPVENATVLPGRASALPRGAFDFATARAVPLTGGVFGDAGFLASGGSVLLWTTEPESVPEELSRAGFRLAATFWFRNPGGARSPSIAGPEGSCRDVPRGTSPVATTLERGPGQKRQAETPFHFAPRHQNAEKHGPSHRDRQPERGRGKDNHSDKPRGRPGGFRPAGRHRGLRSQANATSGLGFSGRKNGANAYDVLLGAHPSEALRETGFPNLWVIPSGRDLVGARSSSSDRRAGEPVREASRGSGRTSTSSSSTVRRRSLLTVTV